MSPEYKFYIKASLRSPRDAGDLVAKIYETPGVSRVEVVQGLEPQDLRGDVIRQARLGKGWSQREMSRYVSLSTASISQIENNRGGVSVQALDRIATALELDLSDEEARAHFYAGAVTNVSRGRSSRSSS